MAVEGTRAYLLTAKSLHILDVSDPGNVKTLGSFAVKGQGIQIEGARAYVTLGYGGYQILDVSDPVNVKLLGQYSTQGYAFQVQVINNIAYEVDDAASLQLFDISDPAQIRLVGGLNINGSGADVALSGARAYLADGPQGLQILDISSPGRIRPLGSYNNGGGASGVQVVESIAYLAQGTRLQMLDVSDPTKAQPIGSLDVSNQIRGFQVVGKVAYVAANSAGLKIWDVSNAGSVRSLGAFKTATDAWGVRILGTTAYIVNRFSRQCDLQMVDVSNPARARLLGSFHLPLGSMLTGSAQVVESLAYLTDETYGLIIVDVRDPLNVKRVGGYACGPGAYALEIVGKLAYVAAGNAGLHILDVSDPHNLKPLGDQATDGESWAVSVQGDAAYVAAGSLGLRILEGVSWTPPVVVEPPTISQQPVSLIVTQGGTATLSVMAQGQAPLSYQWQWGGTNLTDGTNAILAIANVQKTHAGYYSVLVSNAAGVTNSRAAQIVVVDAQGLDLATALDASDLAWGTSGSRPWTVATNVTPQGIGAASSGAIGNDQESVLETTVAGPGVAAFWWKVSSQSQHDWLRFSVAGQVQAEISGEEDWAFQRLAIPAGAQT